MKTKVCLSFALFGMGLIGPLAVLLWSGDAQNPALPGTAGSQTSPSKGPPPLVVDKNAPLLLDELPATNDLPPQKDPALNADNAACFVCHANFKGEALAQTHAQASMGCVDCHGKSFAHRNDENNTTPPEKMYPLETIDQACRACHPTHDVPAAKVVARAVERGLGKADPKAVVCTACHGHHRLTQRTVRWDKKTGKLLPRP
ncbi:MAG TPA: hypothetical protein P5186_23600 [Candidatus Paceibacterota bacterium]|nr:hypothetical protein [Verrucomicrobiota bacterium]HRY51044.1 hypothetical protein [Candidatus Paceibacterota bacterium]HSA01558.1 hypothetical protein [Candidatus Paceibacterota bacterium]